MIAFAKTARPLRLPGGLLWTLVYGTLALILLRDFVRTDSAAFWTGVITCAVLAGAAPAGGTSYRFGYLALFLALLYFFLPISTARYAALASAGLFLLESRSGRVTLLLPLTLLLASPIFGNLSAVFAFPLRLELTRFAALILAAAGQDAASSGNLIRSGGLDFSVDPACMGLHMLQCALLCCIMLIGLWGQRLRKRLSAWWVAGLLLVCFGLNLGSNLLRILLLVQFQLAPETAMHELVGVLSLAAYVLLPCGLLIRWVTHRYGTPEPVVDVRPMRQTAGLHLAVVVSLLAGYLLNPPKWDRTTRLPAIPGYTARRADSSIVRLSRDEAVIYLKDLQGFYGSEHHPMLCWTGSGYRFREVHEDRVAGLPVMRGVLERDGRCWTTAWWYASDGATFCGPAWRWDALRSGRSYSIVNVTVPDETQLEAEVRRLAAAPGLQRWLRREDR